MTVTEILVAIIVAILTSGAFSAIVSSAISHHYARKNEKTEEEKTFRFVMEALAHDAFFDNCRTLLRKDSITEEELDNHNYLYKAYHSMGLNSTGDRMHELILEKPVKPQ